MAFESVIFLTQLGNVQTIEIRIVKYRSVFELNIFSVW